MFDLFGRAHTSTSRERKRKWLATKIVFLLTVLVAIPVITLPGLVVPVRAVCAVPEQDFLMEAIPDSFEMTAGSTATFTSIITVTSVNGFASVVELTHSDPSPLSASLSAPSVDLRSVPSASVTLTISANSAILPDFYTVTVDGSGGTPVISNSVDVSVDVLGPDFSLEANPASLTLNPGESKTSIVTVTSENGFVGTVSLLREIILPPDIPSSDLDAVLSVSSVTLEAGGSEPVELTVTSTPSTPTGDYTVLIIGTAETPEGPLENSEAVSVDVTGPEVPEFFMFADPFSLEILPGSSKSSKITLFSLFGFSGNVNLEFEVNPPPPAGVTATLEPTTVTLVVDGSAESTLTVAVDSSVRGQFSFGIRITGAGGNPPIDSFTGVFILVPEIGISASPDSLAIDPGLTDSSTITVKSLLYFEGTVTLTATAFDPCLEVALSPSTVELSPGEEELRTLSITVDDITPQGIYFVLIGGTVEAEPPYPIFDSAIVFVYVDTTDPTWPPESSLTSSEVGQTSVTLSWTDAEDNIAVETYEILQDGLPVASVDGITTNHVVMGLSPGETYSFRVVAYDGTGNSAPGPSVEVTTVPTNNPPVATDDAYSTTEDTPLSVPAPGVLANDSDPEDGPLTAVLVSGPSSGSLDLGDDGSFTYTLASGFTGTDSFTYRANDGTADSNIATVTITVTTVNDAPVAVNDSYSTAEDTPLSVPAPGVLGNDSDVDGDALTAVLHTGPSSGALVLDSDGSFTYTPNPNFFGTDSFTYGAHDGITFTEATVTITVTPVNDAPVATDDAYGAAQDGSLTVPAPGVLGNDNDVDGDPLTAVLVTSTSNGALTLDPNGGFAYTPNADFSGIDTFTYQASDGSLLSNIATATITVTPNPPPIANPDSYTIAEDNVLSVDAPGVLGNDGDPNGDPITAVLVSTTSSGSLTLGPDGSFSYTPDPNFCGSNSFTYQASDGTSLSAPATVTITVTCVNDAPVAIDDSYSTTEDTPLSVPAPGVLANDSDPENDPLSAVLVSGPSSGTLTPNSDGSFTYTPAANFNGQVSFTYRAGDGSLSDEASVAITVNAINDDPVLSPTGNKQVNEGATLTFTLTATDPDAGQTVTLSASGLPPGATFNPSTGQFSWTPTEAQGPGTFTVTFAATDNGTPSRSTTRTITITVAGPQQAPTVSRPFWEEYWYVLLIVVLVLVGIPVAVKVRGKPGPKSQV